MNEEQLEAQLADQFRRWREMNARQAPAFAGVWAAVRARHERARRRVLLWRVSALAAMTLLCVVLGAMVRSWPAANRLARGQSNSVAVPWRTTVLISAWRSPTDFLCAAPDAGLAFLPRQGQRGNPPSSSRPNWFN
jgi:hypothetical protein